MGSFSTKGVWPPVIEVCAYVFSMDVGNNYVFTSYVKFVIIF